MKQRVARSSSLGSTRGPAATSIVLAPGSRGVAERDVRAGPDRGGYARIAVPDARHEAATPGISRQRAPRAFPEMNSHRDGRIVMMCAGRDVVLPFKFAKIRVRDSGSAGSRNAATGIPHRVMPRDL